MYHVLILIISLSGQPVGIAPIPNGVAYNDEATCTVAIPQALEDFQKYLDEKTGGQFVAAKGKCFSDDEIEQLKHPKSRPV